MNAIYEFDDEYGKQCVLEKSSRSNVEAIYFGLKKAQPKIMARDVLPDGIGWIDYPIHHDVQIPTQMYLTRDHIKTLLPHLIKFVETGDLT